MLLLNNNLLLIKNKNFINFCKCLSTTIKKLNIYKSIDKKIVIENQSCTDIILDKIWNYSVKYPDKSAFIDVLNPQNKRTFKDVFLNSHSLSSFLINELNFKKSDVACIFLKNTIDNASVYLGITLAGGVISPANAHYSSDDLIKQVNETNSTVIFCSEENIEIVLEAKRQCKKIKHIITVGPIVSEFTEMKSILYKNVKKYQPNFMNTEINIDEDLFCLPYSTTLKGVPKPVMLTHKNISTMLPNFTYSLENRIYSSMIPPYIPQEQCNLLFLPMYHMFGLGMALKSLYSGESSVIFKNVNIKLLCKCIEKNKIRIITITPQILSSLAKHANIDEYDLSSLEVIFVGSAPVSNKLCDQIFKKFPNLCQIIQGYGMTELSMVASIGKKNTPISSVGLLIPGYELKIIDNDTKKPLEFNKKGEILLRSDQIMKGYLNRSDDTMNAVDNDGWIHTGDIGYIDENEQIFIVDKIDERIRVKDNQITPSEIEDVISAHPDVKDCAVIGVSCYLNGEVPKGYIVRKNDKLTEEEIIDFVNERVAKFKQLKEVTFVDEIPKSPSGKILRRLLK